MNGTRRIGTWMACALVMVTAGASAAQDATPAQDQLYASARLETYRSMSVAVLPAVAVADDPAAEGLIEANWVALYAPAKTHWMPASEVRMRIARGTGQSEIARQTDREVWQRGEVEPETAARLTRLLGVDAVLSLRIDRWEIADGGRAMVQVSAVLQSSDGSRLWSISGLAGSGQAPGSRDRNFDSDLTWFRDPALEPSRGNARNLDRALYTLLARWAWSLPEGSLFEDGAGDGPLLTLSAED